MSESSKAGKGGIAWVIGIAAALVAILVGAVAWRASSKATEPGPTGGGSNQGNPKGTVPNDIVTGGYVTQPIAEFGWWDAHDRAGNQKIAVTAYWLKSVIEVIDLSQYAMVWQPNQKYKVRVIASLKDNAGKVLSNWGVAMHIFDSAHIGIINKQGMTDVFGMYVAEVELQPKSAGMYRVRVAAGDAVDEEPFEFVMPSNLTMQQAIGG